MPRYILQVHRLEIDAGAFNHTGYDLITIYEDGTSTIQSLDLARINGEIKINYTEPTTAQLYFSNDSEIYWSNELKEEYIRRKRYGIRQPAHLARS
ncbi:MAG: hypothetical protein LBU87_02075 [Lactobacillales bacterium]|jgi:hypothetical protein|nr:hypothetical protein [Lactobacillales bacterium]